MIHTIIFDIGKVLVGYDWISYFMSRGNDEATAERLKDAFFRHGIWPEIDRGIWSEKQLLEGFIQAAPDLEEQLKDCYYHLGDALWQYPFSKDWIRDLQDRGYRVLYLSNWSYHLLAQNPMLVDFTDMMDGGIFSCTVKKIKPNHDIYEELLCRYRLIPGNCVFLDDNPANIKAARECGLQGIVVENHEQAVRDLEAMLAERE